MGRRARGAGGNAPALHLLRRLGLKGTPRPSSKEKAQKSVVAKHPSSKKAIQDEVLVDCRADLESMAPPDEDGDEQLSRGRKRKEKKIVEESIFSKKAKTKSAAEKSPITTTFELKD